MHGHAPSHARGILRARLISGALIVALAVGGASAQSTTEEKNSSGVYQIKAPSIYSLGVTGAGVTAAILDTGIFPHSEFSDRLLSGYNAFDGSTNTTDRNGHGTHVAGIVGAGRNNPSTRGMFGVAYNANLLPVKVLNDKGWGTSTSVATGIQWAVDRRKAILGAEAPTGHHPSAPFVINLSLGGGFSSADPAVPALKDAVNSGMVVAAAAGNEGKANPIWPARYAKEPWANGQIIAVGAVDANNVIAKWSNRAGDTKDYYLVAPGVGVYSTYVKQDKRTKQYLESYATLSGTSMATPYVTGAVALIKSGWTYLTAPQITDILFTSATDLGAPGTDEVYGRGLLNVEAALAPIGALTVPTASGSATRLDGTSVTGSTATRTALQAAGRAGLLQVAGFDRYGRDYPVDLAPAVHAAVPAANLLAPMLAAVDAAAAGAEARSGGTLRIITRSEATRLALGQEAPAAAGREPADGAFAMAAVDAGGRELLIGLSGMGAHAFGLAGELARRGEPQLAPALGNPYFSLAPQHTHLGIGVPLGGGTRMKLGVLVSDPAVVGDAGTPLLPSRHQSMGVAEFSGELGGAVWSVGFGRLQESDSLLGTVQSGALGFAGSSATQVVSFGLAASPTARLRLGAQYTVGYSAAIVNRADSLVAAYTPVRSDAYAAFAWLRDAFRAGDRLTVSVSQPLRAVSGAMMLVAPVGVAEDGSPVMASRAIPLRPAGRELRADVLYLRPLNRRAHWFVGAGLRHEPEHDPEAPRQVTAGIGLRAVF